MNQPLSGKLHEAKPSWWSGVLLSMLVGAGFYAWMANSLESEALDRFRNQARSIQYNIAGGIKACTDVLRGTASHFQASEGMSPQSFHRYVRGLDIPHNFPSIASINFAQYVPHERRAAFEQQMHSATVRELGYPEFRISPPGQRASYTVITLLEPMFGAKAKFGYDLASRPGTAQALDIARDTGTISSSGLPVQLPEAPTQFGMPLRLPVYRADMPVDTVPQRRAAYLGSVDIGFSVPRLVEAAMVDTPVREIRVRLYNTAPGTPPNSKAPPGHLLFDSVEPSAAQAPPDSHVQLSLPLNFNGRVWQAYFDAPRSALFSTFDAYLPWLAALVGFVSTLLMYALFHAQVSSRRRALQMARDMTRELRDSQAKLQLSHQRLRRLAAHAEQIKEEERKRIAREIHDDLGQNLLALRIEADILASRTSVRHPRLHARATATLKQIDDTIRSVRNIINDLRPNVLDLGLSAAVEWQTTQFRKRSGIECDVVDPEGTPDVDDRCAVALFRVLQESLSNIQQHARATHVRVELRQLGGTLRMTIADNGIGLHDGSRNKNGSFGLVGIEERMSLLGGDCSIVSRPHGGTTVTVTVPMAWRATQPAGAFAN
ncbi:CHASE domain-containing protein [Pseudoduganella sp. SL102]|uniref:CHASE domain-containing protein n=1 Tax=Pseudoduganella sp. SL102 TaxID=2995154 RepID=UPI00248B9076|nr:CHASE domain-containing protein [Pseudoduganella sp. SL102]WBS04291.1 CHASE domain-containing protein [Pseudoduganella sp. SL102]